MATKKIPYRLPMDPPVKISSNPGSRIQEELAMKIDENGREVFYVAKKTNIWEKTQADADRANVETIISKVMATGDASLLLKAQGDYMDLTEMPENIFEAHRMIREAEDTFMQLPLDVRKEYDNNFSKYLQDIGTDHWLEIVGLKEKELPEVKPEEKGETE